ncbi:hypothetical protein NL676_024818 [Syzygium grande]|nr:hypothetical protein NL676_024818 [Syzygium grande]
MQHRPPCSCFEESPTFRGIVDVVRRVLDEYAWNLVGIGEFFSSYPAAVDLEGQTSIHEGIYTLDFHVSEGPIHSALTRTCLGGCTDHQNTEGPKEEDGWVVLVDPRKSYAKMKGSGDVSSVDGGGEQSRGGLLPPTAAAADPPPTRPSGVHFGWPTRASRT